MTKKPVVLSAAKGLVGMCEATEILRCAQDDDYPGEATEILRCAQDDDYPGNGLACEGVGLLGVTVDGADTFAVQVSSRYVV